MRMSETFIAFVLVIVTLGLFSFFIIFRLLSIEEMLKKVKAEIDARRETKEGEDL